MFSELFQVYVKIREFWRLARISGRMNIRIATLLMRSYSQVFETYSLYENKIIGLFVLLKILVPQMKVWVST
jgi:urea transporter